MYKTVLLSVLFLFSGLLAFSQPTGDFKLSVDFDEIDYAFNRDLYFHVPADYDASESYKLVVGFRGGPHANAGQFRDQLSFLSDSIGAIILCPENKDHFWNEEGLTKQLFNYAVDTASSLYNIDTNFIYLTGLSYGGRHAVIVSMDTDAGEIPKLRGVIPFAAGSESDLQPNYANIDGFPPACLCIGLNDSNSFINVSNNLHNDIISNGGKSILNEIPGVGHTVAFPSYPDEMMECIQFIEDQYIISSTVKWEEKQVKISIYPNPSTGDISINSNAEFPISQIQIYNAFGQLERLIIQ